MIKREKIDLSLSDLADYGLLLGHSNCKLMSYAAPLLFGTFTVKFATSKQLVHCRLQC